LVARGLAWEEIEKEVEKPEAYSSVDQMLETQDVFPAVKLEC
jgi:hypothetical protein